MVIPEMPLFPGCFYFCRYDMKLMLFIGVDSENKSVVLAQGFFPDEQTTSFAYAIKHFVQICGGHPCSLEGSAH